jgi:hypothetical protein
MGNTPRFEERIRRKIEKWYDKRGDDFTLCVEEFCQGNRASLRPLMALLKDLGTEVFASDGMSLNRDLGEDLEYRIFDLIGKFTSTPGGPALLAAIKDNIIEHLTEIFVEAKKRWNFNYYKITESYEELDPHNCLIPPSVDATDNDLDYDLESARKIARRQARVVLDQLVLFVKAKLRGEKNRKIAINWLENPEKANDTRWLSSLAGSSIGSTKVTLTRTKHTIVQYYDLKRMGNRLLLGSRPGVQAQANPRARQHTNIFQM